nr:AAA domain-containing protein [Staphylococcus sp. MI 10-1553]
MAFAKKELESLVNPNINLRKWLFDSIGTVHTFQGKEADKVYFVTGTDDTQNAAIQWSCQKPNLINVAVTRAKKEFIVIGDKKRISQLKYYQAIDKGINNVCEDLLYLK